MFRRPLLFTSIMVVVCLSACIGTDSSEDTPSEVVHVVEPLPEQPEQPVVVEEVEDKRDFFVPAASDGKYDPVIEEQTATPAANTEQYVKHPVNPFIETVDDPLSTFAVDVDTGSYTVGRRKIRSGVRPPPASVRVEEYVNYFHYDYPEPAEGPFAVALEGAPSPFVAGTDTTLMRVGIQGKRVDDSTRKPVRLTFLVDVSGSMNRPDKLGLAIDSLEVLTNNLGSEDSVAIATYAGRVSQVLEPTRMSERGKIIDALRGLRAGGSTAMSSGLELAYKLALQNYDSSHVNRVIVLSDGDANIGRVGHDEILEKIAGYVEQGVTLSTIGFGMGNYKDHRMEQLANKGNGNYYYIDSLDEARKVFGEQINGTLQVIAKDVKIQVEFHPDAVERYRLIGYENRDIADSDFRDDTVDAGEIGAGHTVTALYEVKLKPDGPDRLATVRVRHMEPQGDTAEESLFRFHRLDVHSSIGDASKDFQFAAAVTTFAEILRHSPYAEGLDLELVEEVALGAAGENADRLEFLELVRAADALPAR